MRSTGTHNSFISSGQSYSQVKQLLQKSLPSLNARTCYFTIFRSLTMNKPLTYYQIKILFKLRKPRNCHVTITSIGKGKGTSYFFILIICPQLTPVFKHCFIIAISFCTQATIFLKIVSLFYRLKKGLFLLFTLTAIVPPSQACKCIMYTTLLEARLN